MNELIGLQYSMIGHLLGHIADSNNLNPRIAVYNIPQHLRNDPIDILILVHNQNINMLHRQMTVQIRLNRIRDADRNVVTNTLAIGESMVVRHPDPLRRDFYLCFFFQKPVKSQIQYDLIWRHHLTQTLNRSSFAASDAGFHQHVPAIQRLLDKRLLFHCQGLKRNQTGNLPSLYFGHFITYRPKNQLIYAVIIKKHPLR